MRLLEAIHRRFGLPPSLPERITIGHQDGRPHRRLLRGDAAGGLHRDGGQPLLRRAARRARRPARAAGGARCHADRGGPGGSSSPASTSCQGREVALAVLFGTVDTHRECDPTPLSEDQCDRATEPSEVAAARAARKTGSIHVCPLSAVPQIVVAQQCLAPADLPAGRRAGRDAATDPARPAPAPAYARHRRGDAGPHRARRRAHRRAHRLRLAWGGQGPMVVHCWAGISRSTAAAFTALCAINPQVPEELIARRLREASPTAYPEPPDDPARRRGARPQRPHGARRREHRPGDMPARPCRSPPADRGRAG